MASIYKDGSSWRCQVRRPGQPTLSKSFERKIDAQKWARKIENQIDERRFHEPVVETAKTLFLRYKKYVSANKRGGRWEELRIDAMVRDVAFMKMQLSSVDGPVLKAWRDARLKEVSAATVNREINLISSVFSHAIKEWDYKLAMNPVQMVKRPPKTKARSRRVSAAELEAVWDHFGREVPVKTKQYIPWMFEFSIETGLRMGELCALQWSDVHESEAWMYVRPGKNGDSRDVPLSQRALALLAQLPRTSEGVFPVNSGSVGTMWRTGCAEMGIEDLHFHDARHEATSRLAKKLSVMELAAVIGHRDLKSLLVYYNPTAQELAQKLGAAESKPPRL